ncbi:MAG: YihY/virulence factor BrkB family protein [Oscillospiraceae bacterium]|jgi:membrane protein|nr:YihY/virulence factor BrkB family protein [Oscillospiraceae bacterium]
MKGILRFIRHVNEDDVVGTAAKTAFFFLLALFPLAMLADWALAYAGWGLSVLEGFLPDDLLLLMADISSPSPFANPLWALGALWASSSGVLALMRGVGQAYSGQRLPFFRARGLAILFTLGFLAVLSFTIAFLAADRWILAFVVGGAIFLLLLALYTLTPGVPSKPARAAWMAALATAGWLLVSRGFEIYMRYFSRYDALYGSVGIFLGIAVWVFLICFVIVIAAELGGYKD